MKIKIESLGRAHDRGGFDCGVKDLNDFLKRYAFQNQKKHISRTFVAVDTEEKGEESKKDIFGFYTLSIGDMNYDLLPDDTRHPKHPVSIARLARLAVGLKRQGQGIGGFLLHDALQKIKSASKMVGIFAVVVDAKDTGAKLFYEHYGFVSLEKTDLTLFLPMKIIEDI